MTSKQGEIILCSGIKMDKEYENVVSYSEEQMVNLCRNNQIYNGFSYSIIQPTKTIDIAARYEDCIYANYMAFINPKYGNKWFFAWVTNVELRNPSTTRITFQVDVFSTWYSRFNLNQVFIEREHVDDDTIGKHTLPEGLETGEYIAQISNNSSSSPNLTNMYYLSDTVIIAAVTTIGLDIAVIPNTYKYQYGGVYSGLTFLAFKNAYDFNNYKRDVAEEMSDDNVVALFMAPLSVTGIAAADWIQYGSSQGLRFEFEMALVPDSAYETNIGDIGYPKADHLDNDYVPLNKKLLTFPFCFLNVTNNVGGVTDYHYELFNGSSCGFNIKGSLGVGCSIKMFPVDYAVKGTGSNTLGNKLHSIDAGKLPTCPWTNDAFTNWLTSQAVNIPLNIVGSVFSGVASGGVAGGIVGGFASITNSLASIYEHSLQPPISKGGTNQGDLNFALRNTYNIYPMSIKKEYAEVIDRYFSRFGYKVNEVKTPNLNSRTKFNFIKVGGLDELVSGNIPAVDLEEINRVFRKGVTIFHNYNDIGNYTVSNPIVTP